MRYQIRPGRLGGSVLSQWNCILKKHKIVLGHGSQIWQTPNRRDWSRLSLEYFVTDSGRLVTLWCVCGVRRAKWCPWSDLGRLRSIQNPPPRENPDHPSTVSLRSWYSHLRSLSRLREVYRLLSTRRSSHIDPGTISTTGMSLFWEIWLRWQRDQFLRFSVCHLWIFFT